MLIEHPQIACLILPKLIFCVGLFVIIWDAFLIFSYIHQGATDRLLRHCHVICLFFYLVTFKWNVNCLYILDFCVFTPAAFSAVRQFKNVKKRHKLSSFVTKSREQAAAVTSGQLTVEYRGRRPNPSFCRPSFRSLFTYFAPILCSFSWIFLSKMASQSQGIQQLLQAEKRAAEKVAEARKRE